MIALLTAIPVVGPWIRSALSPIGLVAMVAIGAVSLYGVGFHRGKARAAGECQVAALRAEIATLKADIAIARRAEAEARTLSAAIEAAAQTDQKLVEELRNVPPSPSCIADPAGARRVHGIGTTRSGR